MNKFFTWAVLAVLAGVSLVGYWYKNPHKMPEFLRGNVPGISLPAPRSPMTGFKAPQF
jgi:hypothetical protein